MKQLKTQITNVVSSKNAPYVYTIIIAICATSCGYRQELAPQNTTELVNRLLSLSAIQSKDDNNEIYQFTDYRYREFVFDSSLILKTGLQDVGYIYEIKTPGVYRKKLVVIAFDGYPLQWFESNDISHSLKIEQILVNDIVTTYNIVECSRYDLNYSQILIILNTKKRIVSKFRMLAKNSYFYDDSKEEAIIMNYGTYVGGIVLEVAYMNSIENNDTDTLLNIYLKEGRNGYFYDDEQNLLSIEAIE